LIDSTRLDILDLDGRGGHNGPGGIGDRSRDGSAVALREDGAREREDAGRNYQLFHRDFPQS
jgi:hypothetical protein